MNARLRHTRRETTREPGPYLGAIPSEPCEPLKHVAFCAMGGGGSSTLLVRLQSYARFVGRRPDNCFLPSRSFDRILEPGAYHLEAYDHHTRQLACQWKSKFFNEAGVAAGFHKQSGYRLDHAHSMDDNMLGYLAWLRAYGGAAVFWQLAGFGFFSLHRIPDVVFLIRRPLDTWLSLTEPWRHRSLFDEFGGRETPKSLNVFCRWWNGLALEYLWLASANLRPVLVRYDRAPEDAEALPDVLAAQFAEGSTWRPRLRDPDDAPTTARDYIESNTAAMQARIWED